MIGYYFRLALRSFAHHPGLTAIMVAAIGLGIAVCVITLTVYHAMSGNPIWWKDDRLYSVTIDSWAVERPANRELPHLPPMLLTHRDATYLFGSNIPTRKVMSFRANGIILGGMNERKPLRIRTRVTTADFFPMFDVPVQYGGAWNAGADLGVEPVIVLSKELNDQMFGGANSVGRTISWNNREFRIIGVLAHWRPQPKFFDLTLGPYDSPEEAFIPWGWAEALQLRSGGSGTTRCWKFEPINTYAELLGSECTYIQMWVELPTANARGRMQTMLDAYWAEQRKTGRFQRPQNNRLTPVSQWLQDHEVVADDNRLLVWLAFAFLGVCLINTVGLLLAKFLNAAATSGVRRALGASRRQIFTQHLVEASVLATAGSLFGLLLSVLGLWGVRAMYVGEAEGAVAYSALAHFDLTSIGAAIALAIVAALTAGLYPAWRIGRLSPAVYLKSQ